LLSQSYPRTKHIYYFIKKSDKRKKQYDRICINKFIMNQTIRTLKNHKSIRKFKSIEPSDEVLRDIIECGIRSSSSGNMQGWSLIITKDKKQKEKLYKIHRKQKMILEAPVTLTFLSDFHRTLTWLDEKSTKKSFDDFLGFLTGATDAIIAAQAMVVAAESFGLGACYMGTTWWGADKLSKLFKLPDNVFPVTSLVLGQPNESIKKLRDRLPFESMVFEEEYKSFTKDEILKLYKEKEERSWERYNSFPEIKQKILQYNIKNVAQYYTSEIKYGKKLHEDVSKMIKQLLSKKNYF
jgi:nitroreductase